MSGRIANSPAGGGGLAQGQAVALSKAQQFEDEKRRIMQSCFSKMDPDGSLLESYITHCRVTEDSGSSAEPPPPGASAENRKARIIMVAVRKSGRVRMHKARENPNGSFSIGKTWNLDDLQSITTHGPPNERGFTVTILKPYYWQANSVKEKDFFISSLLKIYKKYTGGKVPELLGFSPQELEVLLAPVASSTASKEEPSRAPSKAAATAGTPSAASSVPRKLSGTPSNESFNSSKSGPYLGPRPSNSAGIPTSPNAVRGARSTDGLSNRRVPSEGRRTPPPPSGTPPIPQGGPLPPSARRPSDGSTRSGNSRTPSSSRPPQQRGDDERSMRRQASQERLRSPSIGSQRSQDSRSQQERQREAMEQYPLPNKPTDRRPSEDSNRSLPKKKSSKDVASQFRLAANTYGVGNKLASPHPRTPTTPTYGSALSREPSNMSSPPEPMPPISYSRRPSEESRRPRSRSRGSQEQREQPPPPIPVEPSPSLPKEPPPRSEARSRNASQRENGPSTLNLSAQLSQKATPSILEPALNITKPPIPTAVVSPPPSARLPREEPPMRDPGALRAPSAEEPARPESRDRKRRSTRVSDYLEGMDKSQLSVDIDALLTEFHWDGRQKAEELQAKVRKELSRVESSNVVINVDSDDRIDHLSTLLDMAIKECEEMDGLLTLYAVELTSLNDDIAHIENQSQGLQVQTTNQKTLQKELSNLLDTISISSQQMEVLKQGSLESSRGLEQVEQTLVALYKAIKTIESGKLMDSASSGGYGRRGSFSDGGVGSMRALQERKDEYRQSCRVFLGRVRQFLNIKFQAELLQLKKTPSAAQANTGLKPQMLQHDSAYHALWKFAGLIEFARHVDGDEYVELRRLYEQPAKGMLLEEIHDNIEAWKRIAKTEGDQETPTSEKEEHSSGLSAARKLTVKKSIARIRTGGGSFAGGERPTPGIINAHESFAGALSEIYTLVLKEQNFVVDLFHLSSSTRQPADFVEFITTGTPETRALEKLDELRSVETDKLKAKSILEYVGNIFSPLFQELQNMIDWAIQIDSAQGVGILWALEQKIVTLERKDQEFLNTTLQKLHTRLSNRLHDDEAKATADPKVKIKKRKGFMRVFPHHSDKKKDRVPSTPASIETPDSGESPTLDTTNE